LEISLPFTLIIGENIIFHPISSGELLEMYCFADLSRFSSISERLNFWSTFQPLPKHNCIPTLTLILLMLLWLLGISFWARRVAKITTLVFKTACGFGQNFKGLDYISPFSRFGILGNNGF